MTIRIHLADLMEQRETYVRLLDALESGKLLTAGPTDTKARCAGVRRKLRELDRVIKAEAARRQG